MQRTPLLLVAALTIAACSRDNKPADSGLQDLSLAGQVQQQTPPTLKDTAIVEAPIPQPKAPQRAPQRLPDNKTVRPAPQPQPVAQAPAPAPPPVVSPAPTRPVPEPVVSPVGGGGAGNSPLVKEVSAGTSMNVKANARVCTNTNHPGDKIVAALTAPITGSNGAVLPAGTTVVLEVASVTPGDTPEKSQITFRLRAVMVNDVSHSVTGDVTPLGTYERTQADANKSSDTKKVVGGAIAGAIAGKILGGNAKGAAIGAAAGAATGAVVANNTRKTDVCLPEGSPLKIVLGERIVL